VRLEAAQVLLKSGSVSEVEYEGPLSVASTSDGVLVTQSARVGIDGPPPICRLTIPNGATVDLRLATGGLTVRTFQGTLRARVQSGGVSVEQSEGRFRVVALNGRVAFERVGGEINILASNGSVMAHQTTGGLQAVSNGGAMQFDDIGGPLVARTSTGSIDASNLRGTARLSTHSGAVRVSGVCAQLTVRTHTGDIGVDCSIAAHTTLETHKGNLDLKLGSLTNAHIEAKVGQGVVRAERIAPLPGSSRRILRSTLGLGQFRLRVTSGTGVINVEGPPPGERASRLKAGA